MFTALLLVSGLKKTPLAAQTSKSQQNTEEKAMYIQFQKARKWWKQKKTIIGLFTCWLDYTAWSTETPKEMRILRHHHQRKLKCIVNASLPFRFFHQSLLLSGWGWEGKRSKVQHPNDGLRLAGNHFQFFRIFFEKDEFPQKLHFNGGKKKPKRGKYIICNRNFKF